MLAEFSIIPMDSAHLSKDVARAVAILEASGLPYRVGPLGTCVEGDWDQVMRVIRRCQQTFAQGHERVITHITIDEHPAQPHRLHEMVQKVEEQLGRRVPRADMDAVC